MALCSCAHANEAYVTAPCTQEEVRINRQRLHAEDGKGASKWQEACAHSASFWADLALLSSSTCGFSNWQVARAHSASLSASVPSARGIT